jgi:hypothetical protein
MGTDLEHDKKLIRLIFEQFKRLEKAEFKTEVGNQMGEGLLRAVKEAIRPYMVTMAKRIK